MTFRILLLILFYFLSIDTLSQDKFSSYVPSVGVLFKEKSDIEKSNFSNYMIGFNVRRTNKFVYLQSDINLLFNSKKHTLDEMRIPLSIGINAFKVFRAYAGAELRSDLEFMGMNKKGFNQLTYDVHESNRVYPIVGIGLNVGRINFDARYINTSDIFGNRYSEVVGSFSYMIKRY